MKSMKYSRVLISSFILFGLISGCRKSNSDAVLYTPTSSDVTAKATLAELQQGRTLYMGNCGSCHGLYSPDDFAVTQWKNIMNSMAPKTRMTASETLLVTKYVTRGNQ
jgi:mono/diheme cytochrome c family protein